MMHRFRKSGTVIAVGLVLLVVAGIVYGMMTKPSAPQTMGAIMSDEQAIDLTYQCSRPTPDATGTWKPTKEDILAMEALMPTYVESRLREVDGDPLTEYYLQYGGIIVNDQRVIYINAMRKSPDFADWRTDLTIVCDGGSSFWGLEYDPQTKTFSGFAANFEA